MNIKKAVCIKREDLLRFHGITLKKSDDNTFIAKIDRKAYKEPQLEYLPYFIINEITWVVIIEKSLLYENVINFGLPQENKKTNGFSLEDLYHETRRK